MLGNLVWALVSQLTIIDYWLGLNFPLKRLQKSLQNFQVREEKDWAKKRRPDEWDSNYDQGKTKKVKNKNNYDRSVGIGKKLQKVYEAKHMILSTI